MLNSVMLVGRLTGNVEIKEENGEKYTNITLAVTRAYKNKEGIYETDFFTIELRDTLASQANEYCNKGDIIGIRGRIETQDNKTIIIADKMTFLASSVYDKK